MSDRETIVRKLITQLLGGQVTSTPASPTSGSFPSLSPTEALILQMLIREGEMYGLQMVDTSEGQLKRGTVYVTLGRMEKKGYVGSRQEEQPPGAVGLPRRLYKITGLGQKVLQTWERTAQLLIKQGVAL